MSGYPYSQDIPSSAEYRGSGGYATTSSAQDYSIPSTEASLSRTQSSSSFGGARSPYSHHHSPSLHSGGFGGHSPSYTYPGGGYTTAPPYSTYGGSTLGPQSTYGGSGHSRRSGGAGTPHADPVILEQPKKPQCWEHGCNGRYFSTFSNLLRHQREKSGTSHKSVCHRCGAEFTRKTARDGHLAHDKCKGGRRERD